jgi:hypothetical protein
MALLLKTFVSERNTKHKTKQQRAYMFSRAPYHAIRRPIDHVDGTFADTFTSVVTE